MLGIGSSVDTVLKNRPIMVSEIPIRDTKLEHLILNFRGTLAVPRVSKNKHAERGQPFVRRRASSPDCDIHYIHTLAGLFLTEH